MITAAMPNTPVVASIEGRYPKPELNRAFQKIVLLTAAGLNLSQLYTKVLGPVPKMALFFNDFWAISKVADKEGLTSVEEVFKILLMLPAVPRNSVKKITAISANKDTRRKFLVLKPFACSEKRFLNNAIMNISKEKTPNTTQLLKKLADIIAKKAAVSEK